MATTFWDYSDGDGKSKHGFASDFGRDMQSLKSQAEFDC